MEFLPVTEDNLGGSTTPAHEDGHGFGLPHDDKGGQTPTDRPNIMEARGTQVNPRWSIKGPSNDIDPNFRRVNQKNIDDIMSNIHFYASGKANIGKLDNVIF